MRNRSRPIILFLLLTIIVVGVVFGLLPWIKEYRETAEEEGVYDTLKKEVPIQITQSSDADHEANETAVPADSQNTMDAYYQLEIDFDALRAINPETIGWLYIPDTPIHYPVLYAEDTQKYINYNFYGEPSASGALFLEGEQAFDPPSQNVVIYGHNMGRGKSHMFSTLIRYKDPSYLTEHSTVYFDTVYQRGIYEVFSVIHTKLNDGFAYSKKSFASEEEFMSFIDEAQSLSLHECPVVVHPSDEIVSLSTCDRSKYGADGRLVIMAVKVSD